MYLSSPVYTIMLAIMEGGLAAFVRRRRGDLGLTQKELADRMGVIPARVSQIETGDPKWPQTLVPALAKALDVSQVELALAAGVITEAKATREQPFPEGDKRRMVLALLPELRDDDVETVRVVADSLVKRRQTLGAEESVPNSDEAMDEGALALVQGKALFGPVGIGEDKDGGPTVV